MRNSLLGPSRHAVRPHECTRKRRLCRLQYRLGLSPRGKRTNPYPVQRCLPRHGYRRGLRCRQRTSGHRRRVRFPPFQGPSKNLIGRLFFFRHVELNVIHPQRIGRLARRGGRGTRAREAEQQRSGKSTQSNSGSQRHNRQGERTWILHLFMIERKTRGGNAFSAY